MELITPAEEHPLDICELYNSLFMFYAGFVEHCAADLSQNVYQSQVQ